METRTKSMIRLPVPRKTTNYEPECAMREQSEFCLRDACGTLAGRLRELRPFFDVAANHSSPAAAAAAVFAAALASAAPAARPFVLQNLWHALQPRSVHYQLLSVGE